MGTQIVIIGANGQLGSDLMRVWAAVPGCGDLRGLTHAEIEVSNLESVRAALLPLRAAMVVNTSAFHRVDDIEAAPDRAFAVNTLGPRMALVCRELDAILIHLSTDYVFSGRFRFFP